MPVEDDRKLERVGADDGVARGVDEAFAAVGQRAAHLLACRDDDHVRPHGKAEFERAAANGGAVLGFQADAGASEAWCGGRCKRGNQRRDGGLRIIGGTSVDAIAESVRATGEGRIKCRVCLQFILNFGDLDLLRAGKR